MNSDDFLIRHAYRNVWCAPEQDRQHVFRPARITHKTGARGSVDVLWKNVTLPEQGPRYHVFTFSNLNPGNLNINIPKNTWVSAGVEMNENFVIIDIYTERGLMIPRQKAYLLYTDDGNIAMAVEHLPKIGDFGVEDVYVRFYSNEFFNRADMSDPEEGVEYAYGVPTNTSQINQMTNKLRQWQAKSGYVFTYVNGWRVNDVNTATVMRGDMVEFVRDSSVEKVEEFQIEDLPVFLSELDEKQKYLVHPVPEEGELIRYRDDIDMFLLYKETPYIHRGVFYHKNQEDAVRHVTHRDVSIPAAYVDRLCSLNPNWAVNNQLTLQLVTRRSGMDKDVMSEAHHIKELYRLEGDDWFNAVIGTDAVVSVWRIEELEKSMYPALMRAKGGTITREMVEAAYGYNTITKIIADTPQKVPTEKAWVELPFAMRGESTIYEYDANGVLLGWFPNQSAQWYVPRYEATRYIEGIVGRGSDVQSTVYAASHRPDPSYAYRCYICPIVNNRPNGEWVDVTDESEYYDVIAGEVVWKVNPADYYTAVKMDDTFLTYNLELDYPDGLLRFHLNVKEIRIDGILYNGLVEIPSGLLEFWLNGHPIIEGLDWFMNDQEYCIINKQYRKQDGTADVITIRSTGFCNKDMTRVKESEYGFVEDGLLSRNNRWNLRDDKVIRVIANGRLYSSDELSWSEDKPEVRLTNVRNGAPYQVTEPLIPLRGLTYESAYDLRATAEATDREIEDYMSTRVEEIPAPDVNLIPYRHTVYSPFVAKIIHDLEAGYIDSEPLKGAYTDVDVRRWCEPYMWLLPYEPTMKGFDERYIVISAHEKATPIELPIYQYNFVARLIRVMLEDKIDITHSVVIHHLPI